jgi:hypothetical protein
MNVTKIGVRIYLHRNNTINTTVATSGAGTALPCRFTLGC